LGRGRGERGVMYSYFMRWGFMGMNEMDAELLDSPDGYCYWCKLEDW